MPPAPPSSPGPLELRVLDDSGDAVVVEGDAAGVLWAITEGFDAATVSACGECRCRVLAAVAVVDLLDQAPAHPASGELCELADEAPTLHLYLAEPTRCTHRRWLDPLAEEWFDVVEGPRRRPLH